jgi:uncharacterized protein YkwD
MRAKTLLTRRTAAVAMTLLIGVALSSCGFANASSAPPSDPYQAALFNSLNYNRLQNGLPPLTWSPKLANAAGTWAWQMAATNGLYHQNLSALISSPDYAGYRTMGENILVAPADMSATQAEAQWMASPPHRANILSGAFNIVGIGYVRDGSGRIWLVQDFGGV